MRLNFLPASLMKTSVTLLCGALISSAAAAETLTVFKAAASIPTVMVVPAHFDGNKFFDDVYVLKTLKSNDLINLALGRGLNAKVDAKTEVLALAVVNEGPGAVSAPATRVIVYNPDPTVATDSERITATIFTLSSLDFSAALVGKKIMGFGVGSVALKATADPAIDPAGDASKNKFFASTLKGAGIGSATISSTDASLLTFTFTLKSFAGALHYLYTDAKNTTPVDFDGIVDKATFAAAGKPLKTLVLP